MLFITWQALEWKSLDRSNLESNLLVDDDNLEEIIPITEQLNTPPPPPPPPPASVAAVILEVEDEAQIEESVIESTETNQNQEILEVQEIQEVEEEEEIVNIPFAVIEKVPIFPGCENVGNNAAQKKCMSEGIDQFVRRMFNAELATELELEGKQRIFVTFKIDKHGNTVDVRARAPHPVLEQEAVSVVKSLPNMTPGRQGGKNVGVLYSLPILFQVEN